jgi:hypothetical protein
MTGGRHCLEHSLWWGPPPAEPNAAEVIGPLVLIGIVAYLHIFVANWLKLSNSPRSGDASITKNFVEHPYFFNLNQTFPRSLSYFLFYWLVPAVLAFFVWRALPWPGGSSFLMVLAGIASAALALLQLSREPRIGSKKHTLLSLLLLVVAVASLAFGLSSVSGAEGFGDPLGGGRFFKRTLNLRKANLVGQDLEEVNLSGADLREANLAKANLYSANLTGADLLEAHLESARLVFARMAGVILGSAHLENAILEEADLSGAYMMSANLAGAKLDSANLSEAHLGVAT